MDRRQFMQLSAAGLLGLTVGGQISLEAKKMRKNGDYSIVILGDTHFDTEPVDVYHSNYNEPVEWLNCVQREEFRRNGEMWRERCPRLLNNAARLIDRKTRMVFQMGDLIQGDCGKGEVHQKMLSDVMNHFKGVLGGLPFVTVCGNHDIRGTDAEKTYHDYMPKRMSEELGAPVEKTTFSFKIGDDAFIFIDFNSPDDEAIEQCLKDTEGARYTFIVSHGPVFPIDGDSVRWFFHGGASEKHTEKRRYFRRKFAERNAIVLCGHTHYTEHYDWYGDGGRITQMTMSSVWTDESLKNYELYDDGPQAFGSRNKQAGMRPDGSKVKDESALFDEYREGLRIYNHSKAQGSYKLNISKDRVSVDFHGGDSKEVTKTFILR